MSAQIVHEIVNGFCRTCGDTAEWLTERFGASAVVVLDDVLIPLEDPFRERY